MNKPKYIIIHSTDVSWTKNRDQFAAVNSYHKGENFPKSSLGYFVGYQRLITGGKNYQARLDTDMGVHTNQVENGVSINLLSLGICFGGDGDIEYPHPDDYKLLQTQVWTWQDVYSIPNDRVFFHRHFNTAKTCPGSLLGDEWMKNLLTRLPVAKPTDQEVKQIAILQQQITWLQQLINLLKQYKLIS